MTGTENGTIITAVHTRAHTCTHLGKYGLSKGIFFPARWQTAQLSEHVN